MICTTPHETCYLWNMRSELEPCLFHHYEVVDVAHCKDRWHVTPGVKNFMHKGDVAGAIYFGVCIKHSTIETFIWAAKCAWPEGINIMHPLVLPRSVVEMRLVQILLFCLYQQSATWIWKAAIGTHSTCLATAQKP